MVKLLPLSSRTKVPEVSRAARLRVYPVRTDPPYDACCPPAAAAASCPPSSNRSKVAVTEVSASIRILHVSVPLHPPPLQPAKTEPASGAAVTVIIVPLSNEAWHVTPQSI